MRAITYTQLGGPSVLELVERPVPEPGEGEVRIRVHVSGVNPTDWKSRSGTTGGGIDEPRVPNHDGTGGFQNAPDGTQISFTIDSGPGTLTTANPCTTTGGTGSCTITLTSSVTGVTTVSAHTTVSVGDVSLTRHTNGTGANSNPAVKTWVNARIMIAPNATNAVGDAHTFTVTLTKDTGTGVFVPAVGEHVNVTLTNSLGAGFVLDAATSTCDNAGPNTNGAGQCIIVFTSPTPGKVTAHASSTLAIGTPSTNVTVETDGTGGNSVDAVKTFVDANIQITPPTATNRVGVTHTFTAHVNVNTGTGVGFQNAPDGTQISFTIDSGPGSFTSANPCTTAGGTGSCTITLASATTGLTVVSAHTTVSVGGISLTRHTNGTGANSVPAQKTWVNGKIMIAPDATNQVGQSHTFLVTLFKDTGTGVFVPAAGEHATVTLTPTSGATVVNPTGTCLNAGANTDANGQCSITFTSNSTGKVTAHASSTLTIGTPPTTFTVQTDGLILNSGDAVKTFVNAKISIAPDATNEVGFSHTFTVTLQKDPGTGTFEAAAGEHVSFTLTGANGAVAVVDAAASTCDNAGANTDASGKCTIVFNSATPGKITGHASATLLVGPAPPVTITVQTDGTGLNSADAVKTYIDANIQITPPVATNRVGVPHTFTAHVNVNNGTGGFQNAPDGTQISFSIDSGPGGFTSPNPCTTSGGTGSCTITLSSATTGTTVVSAHSSVVVGGLTLTRHTNGTGANSSPANKTWVNARIAIAPSATNQVGQPHTFTVTLLKDTGTGAFVPATNEHVTVTLTDTNGATHTAPTGTCTGPGANTDAAGQCTITFSSPTAGKVTGHASATLSIGSPATTFTVQTDGTGLNTADAVKTYVDANIQITPQTALNPVNTTHVFTAHMNVNAGDGLGFVNAPAGTPITFTKVSGPGSFTTVNPCLTVGATGSCTITLTSAVTGTSVVSASGTVTLAGLSVTRTTNGQGLNSAPAQKTWGSAQISIAPDATNEVGVPHTFTVTLTKDNGSGVQTPAANEHVDFTLTNSNGANAVLDAATSTCDNAGPNTNAQDQCTIVFVSATAGKVTGHALSTLLVGGVSTTVNTPVDAVKTYVDANITITPNGTNPIGTTHTFTAHANINRGDGAGYVSAPAGTTISFTKDSGPGSFTTPTSCSTVGTTGSCQATITSPTAGSTVVSAHVTTSVGGVSLTRHTNGVGANSGPATKVWVAARITIAPSATNEIGHPHTFTVTLEKDSGSGFGPAANEHVTVTLTTSNGATLPTAATGTCTNAGPNTNGSGQCTITFVSPTAGKVTGHAAATLQVGGFPLTVETNGLNGNSADAVKTFVDANIQITPANATNRVGQPHTFTGHVNVNTGSGAFQNAPDGTTITFTINGAAAGSCQTVGGTGSCSITQTSAVTGVWTVRASTTVNVGGVSLTRTTDGVTPNSGPAIKTWVNAKISITPDATNRIGQPHTFTVTLLKDTGNGSGFVAAAGETVTVTLTNSNGAVASPAGPFTGTTNAAGQFQVTFNSATTGKVTGHASSTVSIGTPPATFTVQTDGTAGSSGDAVKTYVDARISITPNATNEVGQPHTFTVTLTKDTGTGSFVPAASEHVDVTLTDSNGAAHTAATGTCTGAGANTNAAGQCTITFTSPTAGKVTGHATASLTIGGVPITIQTNGQAGNSVDAVKTFVDARISITPQTDTNPVNTNHVFTAHVDVNDGSGAGYVSAPAGTSISFTKVSGPGSFTTANPCTTVGTTGSCTITLTSATSGTTVVSASSTLSAGGLTLTRTTNGSAGNSGPASKVWVNARISITPNATNEIGQPHTFTVTLEKDSGTGFGPAAGEHVGVTLTPSNGATLPASPTGTCTDAGANTNASGQCTITFVSPTAGKVTGTATATLTIGGLPLTVTTNGQNGNSAAAVKTFVDANIQINPPTATNNLGEPHVFTAHVNVNDGNGSFANAAAGTVITFTKVSGPGTLSANSCTTVGTTGSCTVTLTNSTTTGTTVVRASTTVTLSGKSVTRSTADGKPGDSADATKLWQKCIPATYTLTGNTASTGTYGNIRTFTASNNIQVKASAFNRASNGAWTTAYLGSYSPGLGVTNRTEDGSDPSHKVDNVGSVDYVMFEFAGPVVINQAVLDAVTGDSDITVWIGTKTDPFNNHQTLSDSFLSGLGFTEVNLASSSAARTADINAGGIEGNILVIAAKTDETTDQFKITSLKTQCPNDCVPGSFTLTGNTASTGTNGNIRTFTGTNSVQMKASAFNRASNGAWTTAYLGSYSSGLGVTNRTEDGSDPSHKVDNVSSVDYVLFEFASPVVVDQAVLDAITDDSDITVWIGNKTDPFNNHQTLSDSFLSSLGFTELNQTSSTASRTADINAGGIEGNVLVIAAETNDATPSDQFKIKELKTSCPDGCIAGTVDLTGNTAATGTNGNIRTFAATNGVQVKASAFNRATTGTWTTAYLGAYSPGLGVTNKNENGADPTHKVDNVDSVDYVLFEFSSPVVVDKAFLDSVTSDSDITVWIGNKTDPFNNHQNLSDSFLSGLGFTEENLTTSTTARTADINAGGVAGNVIVIAAQAADTTPEDQFKIHELDIRCP